MDLLNLIYYLLNYLKNNIKLIFVAFLILQQSLVDKQKQEKNKLKKKKKVKKSFVLEKNKNQIEA